MQYAGGGREPGDAAIYERRGISFDRLASGPASVDRWAATAESRSHRILKTLADYKFSPSIAVASIGSQRREGPKLDAEMKTNKVNKRRRCIFQKNTPPFMLTISGKIQVNMKQTTIKPLPLLFYFVSHRQNPLWNFCFVSSSLLGGSVGGIL